MSATGDKFQVETRVLRADLAHLETAFFGDIGHLLRDDAEEDDGLVQDLVGLDVVDEHEGRYLANQLAYGLFVRLGYSVPGDPEQFIVRVASDYARVNRGL